MRVAGITPAAGEDGLDALNRGLPSGITGMTILGTENVVLVNFVDGTSVKITAQRCGLFGTELLLTLVVPKLIPNPHKP